MNLWVVLPIKDPAAAKSRLGPRVPPALRRAVAEELTRRTLRVLVQPPVLPIVVVTRAAWVAESATAQGCSVLPEAGGSHSAAARQGARWAEGQGADAVLALAADLPLLTPADIHTLARRAAAHSAVIAPDRLGLGTNAILAPPSFPFSFGAPSFQHHVTLATAAGLTVQILRTPGLGVDLDSAWDLDLAPIPNATE